MHLLRTLTSPLRSADTYRRWVHLVLGGALFVPFLLAALVLASLLDGGATTAADIGARETVVGLVAAALAGVTILVPGVAPLQDQLARSLVGGPLADEPPAPPITARSRVRAGCWLSLHLVVGFAVSLATMIALTEAALLALTAVADDVVTLSGSALGSADGTGPTGAERLLGPVLGVLVLVALIATVALVGAGAARLAPVLLGPSAADRIAAAEARADRLADRSRLATELHDSIGHALSVVALQAGAAARVIERDPVFARDALEAIAAQARTATAELDHVLGVLREEQPPTSPPRTLRELPHLVDAARSTGADLSLERRGPLEAVPAVLSREAYRICQEGITNALRHGDGGAPTIVEVAVEAATLRLRITNVPADPRRARGREGHGLLQMRERVRTLGGHLDAGAHDGTWRLDATIPLVGAP